MLKYPAGSSPSPSSLLAIELEVSVFCCGCCCCPPLNLNNDDMPLRELVGVVVRQNAVFSMSEYSNSNRAAQRTTAAVTSHGRFVVVIGVLMLL